MDMLQVGYSTFKKEEGVDENTIVSIAELTLHDLSVEERIDDKDFLQRVDILGSLGQKVMISDYQKYYMLANYISQITKGKIGIILGVFALEMLFDESYYSALKGGILEALGTLFKKNIKLYVYPSYQRGSKDLYTCKELKLPGHLDKLYQYLCECSQITDVQHTNLENLSIRPDHVLEMIKNGKEEWKKMVPEKVVEIIKSKGLFDYKQ
jgi:hypothetical protein